MEKQPDKPEKVTNEPLSSRSGPMELQDAVSYAQLTAARKSKAEKQREYRQRIAATRTPDQAAAARKSKNERQRRLRQTANLAISSGSLEAITTSSSRSGEQSNNVQTRSQRQHVEQQSTTTADQPDERVNLKNEPLFPAIRVPMEVQEAVASTSATPFAKLLTPAPKTRAQIQREYRQRIAATRTPAQAAAAREARNIRERNNRLRQAGSLKATTTSSSRLGQRLNTFHNYTQRQFTDQQRQTLATEPAEITLQPSTSSDQFEGQAQSPWNTKWASSIMRSNSPFSDNDFGYACSICDRLWFRNDLKCITAVQLKAEDIVANVYNYLQTEYEELKSSIGGSCDLSPLANILKRTASATGVSEDTVSAILENKKRAADYECDADVKRVKLTHDYEEGDVSQTTDEESSCEERDEETNDDKELEDQDELTDNDSQQLPIEFEIETVKVEPVYEDETECDVQHQRSSNVGDVPIVSNTTHIKITTQPGVVLYPQSSAGALRVMSIEPITSLATVIKTEPDDEQTHSSVTCTSDVVCDTTLCDVKCEPPDL